MKKADEKLTTVTVKFPEPLLAKVKTWMKRKGLVKTSDGVRMLVARGLELERPAKAIPADVQALIDRVEEDRRDIEKTTPGKPLSLVDAYERMLVKREQELDPPAEPPAKPRGSKILGMF